MGQKEDNTTEPFLDIFRRITLFSRIFNHRDPGTLYRFSFNSETAPTLKNVHTPRQPHWSQDLAFKVTEVSPAKRMLKKRREPMTEEGQCNTDGGDSGLKAQTVGKPLPREEIHGVGSFNGIPSALLLKS